MSNIDDVYPKWQKASLTKFGYMIQRENNINHLYKDMLELIGTHREWDRSEPYDNPDMVQGCNEAIDNITDRLNAYFGRTE